MRSRSWAEPPAVAILIAALAVAGCSGGSGDGDGDATPRIYISLPLRGASGPDGRDAADGARLALADAGERAGGLAIDAVFLDDTQRTAAGVGWTPAKAAANARAASQDSSSIAYLGDFESGATRASLPITNEARMLQVSPAASAVDLVAPFPGTDEVPDAQPTGERSFGRVIPADDAQAAAAAGWALDLGAREAAVRADGSAFGRELRRAFSIAAERDGLALAPDARLTYLAGTPPPSGGDEIGSDAYLDGAHLDVGGGVPRRLTSAALDPSQLPPAGAEFVGAFEDEFGRPPDRYAAYGYEAMAVILDSIDRAADPTDRTAVTEAFFDVADRESILGTYSIDEVGDTTLDRMTGYESDRGRIRPAARITG